MRPILVDLRGGVRSRALHSEDARLRQYFDLVGRYARHVEGQGETVRVFPRVHRRFPRPLARRRVDRAHRERIVEQSIQLVGIAIGQLVRHRAPPYLPFRAARAPP